MPFAKSSLISLHACFPLLSRQACVEGLNWLSLTLLMYILVSDLGDPNQRNNCCTWHATAAAPSLCQ